MINELFKFIAYHYCLNGYLKLMVVYEFVHELVNPKYLIYFGLLTSDKYIIGKITLVRGVKKLVIGSNWT